MKITPDFIINKIQVENYCIHKFVRSAAANAARLDMVLDAGAGDCRYKSYFSHTNYISLDSHVIKKDYGKLSVIGDIQSLPFKNKVFDHILCIQVLEHTEEPHRVLCEFNRVLKPQGSVFLTAPQNSPEHEMPFDYFRFTRFGLQSLFKSAGFKIIFINSMGGYFWYVGNILRALPEYITKNKMIKRILNIFFKICLPLIFFYLDRFDTTRNYTINYSLHCLKNRDLY